MAHWGLAEKGNSCELGDMNWIWIQKNKRILAASAISLSVLLLAIPLWVSYQDRLNQQASEAYYKAEESKTEEEARNALMKVAADFPKSKVSRLARLKAANLDLKLGSFEQAASAYEALSKEIESKHVLRPIVLRGLLSSYEGLKTPEKADAYKKELATLGFEEK